MSEFVEFPARNPGTDTESLLKDVPSKEQFYRDISLRLGVLRRHLGHTQESFAAVLDMNTKTYAAYERGQRTGYGWNRMLYRIMYLNLPYPVSGDWFISGKSRFFTAERDNSRPPVLVSR